MCVTKQRSHGRGSAGCTASEITKRARPCRLKSLKPPGILKEGQEQSVHIKLGNRYAHSGEGWELMASGTRRKIPLPQADMQLPNRFSALEEHMAGSSVYSQASDQHLVAVSGDTDSCRGQRPPSELLFWGALLLLGSSDQGCYGRTAKVCFTLRLLNPAALPLEH